MDEEEQQLILKSAWAKFIFFCTWNFSIRWKYWHVKFHHMVSGDFHALALRWASGLCASGAVQEGVHGEHQSWAHQSLAL